MAAREEDKAMAGLLRRSLAQDAGADTRAGSGEDCPGPEILAAYFDRALDKQETARYELHFSRCSVCREQLAAMARADEASGAFGAAETEKNTASAWDWLVARRWLMPAAAALAALLVFAGIAWRMWKPVGPANQIAMVRPDAVPSPSSEPPENAAPSANPAPPSDAAPLSKVAPRSGNGPRVGVAPPSTTENMIAEPAIPNPRDAMSAAIDLREADKSRTRGATSPSRPMPRAPHGATTARGDELSSAGGVDAKPSVGHAGAPQPPPVMMAQQASPRIVRGAMRAGNMNAAVVAPPASADETTTVNEAAPVVGTAAAPANAPAKKAEAGSVESATNATVETYEAKATNAAKAKSAAPAHAAGAKNLSASQTTETAALAKMQQAQISSNLMNLQIPTPDARILWMIAGPGAIEKSENGGATWKTEYLDTRALLVAGAAPSAKICWLVGASGTILRTTNGTHWKTIGAPAVADFVRVEASDALNATVTAMDGRKFTTADGGKSWSSVQ
jgi:hypothetical protein